MVLNYGALDTELKSLVGQKVIVESVDFPQLRPRVGVLMEPPKDDGRALYALAQRTGVYHHPELPAVQYLNLRPAQVLEVVTQRVPRPTIRVNGIFEGRGYIGTNSDGYKTIDALLTSRKL